MVRHVPGPNLYIINQDSGETGESITQVRIRVTLDKSSNLAFFFIIIIIIIIIIRIIIIIMFIRIIALTRK